MPSARLSQRNGVNSDRMRKDPSRSERAGVESVVSEASTDMTWDGHRPRVFQIGFNKCGTRSFHHFLEMNGIASVHYKRGKLAQTMLENIRSGQPPLQGIDKWTGYTDMQAVSKAQVIEACEFYPKLAEYYPRSYFILNTRNKERWIQSRLNHGTKRNYAERYRAGLRLDSIQAVVDVWSDTWDRHHREVQAFFKKTGQNFLVYDIEADSPEKLSEFLSPDFSTDPSFFDHKGKTADGSDADTDRPVPRVPTSVERTAKKDAQALAPPGAGRSETPGLPNRFMPRNDIVGFDEAVARPPFAQAVDAPPAKGTSGKVIVACMKNEGPFLLEWIAYHRAIGFHNLVIFTNDCEDGTDGLLDRLMEMGIVSHVRNDDWKGNSPQNHALNLAMKHPVVRNAEWIVHIDVDEFINIRTGNGTFDCLLAALPDDVTNIAMTWRLFGSSGLSEYRDRPLIEQFERCAPSFIPKPHTAWGMKTATRNVGAYSKIRCHRPAGLGPEFAGQVKWVNGSGVDITAARAESGWRSDLKTIGYDLVQLNHYALRSLESFLVKRQRGRALHVDRSIGVNYWVRMDWNTHRDVTIQRNLPRLNLEIESLLADTELARLHREAVAWHRTKISELGTVAEFVELAQTVMAIDLDDRERVAAVLAASVES